VLVSGLSSVFGSLVIQVKAQLMDTAIEKQHYKAFLFNLHKP